METIRADEISRVLKEQIKNYNKSIEVAETGSVLSVGDGVARIYGLERAMAGELVEFPNQIFGMVLNLQSDSVGVVFFGDDKDVKEGDTVRRTKKIVQVPVGEALLGRVVDTLGNAIDGRGPLESKHTRVVELKAPGILARKS